jgi:SNF2 family DNA or RNA helicase
LEHGSLYTLYKDEFLNDSFSLKNHQEEGIAWLQHLYEKKASGCLIADDMGLGKTLQVLYFIDWHSRQNPNHLPYLIVAPVSLLENWENEYNRFFNAPRLTINRMTSKDVPRYADKSIVDKMQKMGIILTNYETLRNAQLNFCAVDYDVVVLDEAQKVKSPGTLATNAVKALKGRFKIAMTGTPVENSLLDLWCIMDFCVPGLMGNAKTFARLYQAPLKKEGVDLEAKGKEIHDKMGAYYMRRMKSDVAKDLPNKEIVTNRTLMPKEQMNSYVQALNEYAAGDHKDMLQTIHRLRTISEHPYFQTEKLEDSPSDELIRTSARLEATISYIDKIKERNEKVIVFALFKETQRMLQKVFHDRYGIVAKVINGDTPPVMAKSNTNRMSRQGSINYFQSVDGFNIIIMSPVAAGMGLNVTAANHVIHYSRHWNPAKEQQATDRAYRIGQDKDVFVYYPMAVSDKFRSFDETLDDLLNRKVVLASSAIYPSASFEVKTEEIAKMLFGS